MFAKLRCLGFRPLNDRVEKQEMRMRNVDWETMTQGSSHSKEPLVHWCISHSVSRRTEPMSSKPWSHPSDVGDPAHLHEGGRGRCCSSATGLRSAASCSVRISLLSPRPQDDFKRWSECTSQERRINSSLTPASFVAFSCTARVFFLKHIQE